MHQLSHTNYLYTDHQLIGNHQNHGYCLRWKGKHLFVRPASAKTINPLPTDIDQDWVVTCLARSPIRYVKLDLSLDTFALEFWADAAKRANKQVFVSLPVISQLPQKNQQFCWLLKRGIDHMAASLLLVFLLPIIATLMLVLNPGAGSMVFIRQWHVGERGRLFQTFRLRTVDEQGGWLRGGRWIARSKLDRLPKFLNVLMGEMSLVGSCPWKVADAAQVDLGLRYRLNGLPGITGSWMLQSRFDMLDAYFLSQVDLDYLWNWSLRQDLQLLLSLPRLVLL
jgi:lipopolysaccharide/colanic/teichoic acid biosynthesis glycosyltransferase